MGRKVRDKALFKRLPETVLALVDETPADRRFFSLNTAQWKAFIAALDAPPRPLPRLERLLKEPSFFDAGPHQ